MSIPSIFRLVQIWATIVSSSLRSSVPARTTARPGPAGVGVVDAGEADRAGALARGALAVRRGELEERRLAGHLQLVLRQDELQAEGAARPGLAVQAMAGIDVRQLRPARRGSGCGRTGSRLRWFRPWGLPHTRARRSSRHRVADQDEAAVGVAGVEAQPVAGAVAGPGEVEHGVAAPWRDDGRRRR